MDRRRLTRQSVESVSIDVDGHLQGEESQSSLAAAKAACCEGLTLTLSHTCQPASS